MLERKLRIGLEGPDSGRKSATDVLREPFRQCRELSPYLGVEVVPGKVGRNLRGVGLGRDCAAR
jgi:hypothetical protein